MIVVNKQSGAEAGKVEKYWQTAGKQGNRL